MPLIPIPRVTPGPLPQAVLRSREAVQRYYDCALVADDETAAVPLESRNVVLRVANGGGADGGGPAAGPDSCPHPDPSKAGVSLTRAITERKLYLQVWKCGLQWGTLHW